MTQPIFSKKITLPEIKHISLENFDLYSHQPNVGVDINRSIFCLIGANGLGKSTFLNTVSYAITGAIPEPERRFQSAQDYYKNAARVDRTEDYFNGRISELARPLARAKVVLSWPSRTLEITRDLFEGSGISQLCIKPSDSEEPKNYSMSDGIDSETIGERYEEEILRLTGLEDFAQFVFLFHFVSIFDEGRHLLMWDDGALTNALYLAFGSDPAAAKETDRLKREMEREDSRGRNVRFAARPIAEQISQLIKIVKGEEVHDDVTDTELKAEHESLRYQKEQAEKRVLDKHAELRDKDIKWAQLSSSLTEFQLEYRKLFSSRLQSSSLAEHHPIIRASMSEDRCAVCGKAHISSVIEHKIKNNECPLCDSDLDMTPLDEGIIHELHNLDEQIIKIRDELGVLLTTRDRITAELKAAEDTEIAINEALSTFENKYSDALEKANFDNGNISIKKEIEKLEKERVTLIAKSQEHYKKRDEIRDTLRIFEKQLKSQYEVGAQHFVPRFRELAEEFIGLPVDIELEHRQGSTVSGFGLRLQMNQQLRLNADKLSESQRFFIDIALRMAISELITNGPATLLIDTPEGSLDIAYEARAGSMFSKFIENGNTIVMTANLRSSELVLRLAHLQKKSGMQIERMTDWTELSEVQQSEETLFIDAYSKIESALN